MTHTLRKAIFGAMSRGVDEHGEHDLDEEYLLETRLKEQKEVNLNNN
jgi:hypothetical protein